jgi:hypothetical protein
VRACGRAHCCLLSVGVEHAPGLTRPARRVQPCPVRDRRRRREAQGLTRRKPAWWPSGVSSTRDRGQGKTRLLRWRPVGVYLRSFGHWQCESGVAAWISRGSTSATPKSSLTPESSRGRNAVEVSVWRRCATRGRSQGAAECPPAELRPLDERVTIAVVNVTNPWRVTQPVAVDLSPTVGRGRTGRRGPRSRRVRVQRRLPPVQVPA